jgi:hypothetical protein
MSVLFMSFNLVSNEFSIFFDVLFSPEAKLRSIYLNVNDSIVNIANAYTRTVDELNIFSIKISFI